MSTATRYTLTASVAVFAADGNRFLGPPISVAGPADAPYEQGVTIQPGSAYTFFDGTRTIPADNTTILQFALSPLNVDPIYRFTWVSGTRPGFRTDRGIDLSAQTVVVGVNTNETITMTATAGSFAAVQVADEIMIPGLSTGDPAGPFSEANVGRWVVLAKNGGSSILQLSRPVGTSFSAIGESVPVASAPQVVAMSPGPVRIGDSVRVVAGFSDPVRRGYVVSQVAPDWFEIVTSESLPSLEVGTGGQPPIFYANSKTVASLQFDQEIDLEINGSAPQPWSPISPGQVPGLWLQTGPIWSLRATNRSAQALRAMVRGAS